MWRVSGVDCGLISTAVLLFWIASTGNEAAGWTRADVPMAKNRSQLILLGHTVPKAQSVPHEKSAHRSLPMCRHRLKQLYAARFANLLSILVEISFLLSIGKSANRSVQNNRCQLKIDH